MIAYLSLGSNIEDRMAYLTQAESMLNALPNLLIAGSSKVYETEPWPREIHGAEHPYHEAGPKWFLNQVVKVETSLSPQELLLESQ